MHPITVGQLFCAHRVKVQANKNRTEKIHIHTCTQQILGKKGITSRERFCFQKPRDGKNRNVWVWNSEVWHNIPCFARYSGQSRWKCSTEPHVLHPPPEIYQNISYRNKSFTLKQHQTRDTCNSETGHSCCHLKHAVSLIMQVEMPCCQRRKHHTASDYNIASKKDNSAWYTAFVCTNSQTKRLGWCSAFPRVMPSTEKNSMLQCFLAHRLCFHCTVKSC